MKLIVDVLKSDYEVIINHCDDYVKSLYSEPEERCILAIKNGTPLTPDMLADLLMEERIKGELKQDISYSKDIIDDVKCRLIVDIIDRRPCYCGAELREVWRESEE